MALKRDVQNYEREWSSGKWEGTLGFGSVAAMYNTKDSQLNLERIMMTDLEYSDADLENRSDQVKWDGACTWKASTLNLASVGRG